MSAARQLDMFGGAAPKETRAAIPVHAIVEPEDQCRYHTDEHPRAWVQSIDIDALGPGREIACYSDPRPNPQCDYHTGGIWIEIIKGKGGGTVWLRCYAERTDWTRKGLSKDGRFDGVDAARAAAEAWLTEAEAHLAEAMDPALKCECGCLIERGDEGCPTCTNTGICRQCVYRRHWVRREAKREVQP